jgi:hypothetical protein
MRLFKISDKGELDPLSRLIFEENDVYLVDDKEKNTIYIWVGINVNQSKKDFTAEIARKLDKDRGGSTKILIMKQKREYGSFLAMMHNLEKGLIPGETVKRRPEFVFDAPPESIKSVKLDGTPERREETVESRILQWLTQLKEHRRILPKEKPEKIIESVKFIKFEKESTRIKPQEEIPYEKTTSTEAREQIEEPISEEVEEPDLKTYVREAAYYLSLKKYTYDELCWLLSEKIQKINIKLPSIEDIKKKAEEVFQSGCTYDELCWLNSEMDFLIKKSFLEEEKNKIYY